MKNFYKIIPVVIIFISTSVLAQTYKAHRLEFLGNSIQEATQYLSSYNYSPPALYELDKVNIKIDHPLEPGTTFKLFNYSGSNYEVYRVYASSYNTIEDDDYSIPASRIELYPILPLKAHRLKKVGTNKINLNISICQNSPLPNTPTRKINIATFNKLEVGEIYKLKISSTAAYYKVISSSDGSFTDDDRTITNPEDIIEKFHLNCNDYDYDGINNDNDSCPTTPNSGIDSDGDGIDDACDDIDDSAEADLKFNKNGSSVTSDANTFSVDGTHTLNYYTSSIHFDFLIENIGEIESSSTKIEFYLSGNSSFNPEYDANLNKDISLSPIPANSAEPFSKTIFASDLGPITGTWYIIAKIKADDADNSNNILPIKISPNYAGRPSKPKKLSIYDYSGSEILNQQVESKSEEDEIIQNLEKGMYIIKSGEDTYKVSK